MVEHLPDPAHRWLRHAIAAGTRLRRGVVLRQHGTIRLGGSWRPFTAVQALAPLRGFLWPVTTHLFGLPIHGFDRYSSGSGEMRHQVLGILPVMTATGPDIDRSAAARHTSEIIWAPAAALAPSIRWQPVDDDRVTMLIPCGRWTLRPTVTVSPTGAVRQVTIPRWTDQGETGWHEEPFTALLIDAEATFDGYTIPTHGTAGWGHGTVSGRCANKVVRKVVGERGGVIVTALAAGRVGEAVCTWISIRWCRPMRPRLMAGPNVVTLRADLREPEQVLGNSQVRGLFDFDQPVGIMFICLLHLPVG